MVSGRLAPLKGIVAYGSSAEGARLSDYLLLEAKVGQLNMWRAFHPTAGLPAKGVPSVWSTKSTDTATHLAAAKAWNDTWGVSVFHHEPDGKGEYPDPAVWRTNAEKLANNTPAHVARGACFKMQSIGDGTLKKFIPEPLPWLDILLVDWYPKKNANNNDLSIATPDGKWARGTVEQALDKIEAEATRLGVPWGFAEFGVGGPAAWRKDVVERIVARSCNSPKAKMALWLWFNSSVGQSNVVYDGTSTWRLGAAWDREHPEMETLWRNLASMSRRNSTLAGKLVQI